MVFGSATTIYAYDGDNITEELDSGGSLLKLTTPKARESTNHWP